MQLLQKFTYRWDYTLWFSPTFSKGESNWDDFYEVDILSFKITPRYNHDTPASGENGLEKALDAVDDLVKHGSPIRHRPEELLKVSWDKLLVIIIWHLRPMIGIE